MSRRWTSVLVAGLLVLVACAGDDSSSGPDIAGQQDGPGGLISADEMDADDVDGTVWTVTYRSESIQGDEIEVTGMVARPSSDPPPGGYPVLSWAHGTTGIADDCAPSAHGPDAIPGLQGYLDAGYVVAATDYEGLGGTGVHPYLVSESEARGVLDAARAARQVVPESGEALLVAGHSQGGHAALASAEHAGDWAPELDLLGTVAIAPIADLGPAIPAMFSLPTARVFAVLVAAGWASAYPDLDAADVFGPAGLDAAEQAAEDLCVAEIVSAASDLDADAFIRAQPGDDPEWERTVEENSIDPARVEGPVLVAQGARDDLVLPELTDRFVDDLCAVGADVTYERYDDADHASVLGAGAIDIATWMSERLAGAPTEPTCG